MKGSLVKDSKGWRVFFPAKSKRITRRFKFKEHAERFLNGLRFKYDEGSLDPRDYDKTNPLGFINQTEKFLHSKRHLKAVKKYEQRLRFAVLKWGNQNVKEIGFADFEDLLNDLTDKGLSSKYRKDICDCLRMFFKWLVNRREILPHQMPEFPIVRYSMAYRKIIDKETQARILDEIKRISWDFNPRVYIGISFLSTYVNIRPSELRNIKEKHIDLERGVILIPHPKEGKPKYVPLLSEDQELLRRIQTKQDIISRESYFFRHHKGNGGAKPGDRLGRDYLQRWWNRACDNLGVEGVPMYPGTRHSSTVDLREKHSPEAVKRATMHKTDKAFERYFQVTGDELRAIYADARGGAEVVQFPGGTKNRKSK